MKWLKYTSLYDWKTSGKKVLTFTPPESAPSGQFWCIYALIGGVRVKPNLETKKINVIIIIEWMTPIVFGHLWISVPLSQVSTLVQVLLRPHLYYL